MEAPAPDLTRASTSPDLPDDLVRDVDRDDLSQLVREANDDAHGVSFQKMADRAEAGGHPVSRAFFQRMATNGVPTAPTAERLRGVALALNRPLAVVQRAAAIQYLDYQATELAGYDEDIRVIVAHLAGMEKRERRRWQAMMEADERAKRDE